MSTAVIIPVLIDNDFHINVAFSLQFDLVNISAPSVNQNMEREQVNVMTDLFNHMKALV